MATIGAVNQWGILMVRPGSSVYIETSELTPPTGRHFREICIIGPSNKGDPNPDSIMRFSDLNLAKRILGGDDVPEDVTGETRINPLRVMNVMQHPSAQPEIGGAYLISYIRVGNPIRARWYFEDLHSVNVLDIYSVDYGLKVNEIQIRMEAGDTVYEGTNVYVKEGGYSRTYNDLGRAVKIHYTGSSATALMSITVNTDDEAITLTTHGLAATFTGITLDLTTIQTIGGLVSRINRETDYIAEVDAYADPKMPVKYLDKVTSQDIKLRTGTISAVVAAHTITDAGAFPAPDLSPNKLVGRWVNPNTTDGSTVRVRIISNDANSLTFDASGVDLTTVTASGKDYSILGYGANSLQGSIIWTLNRYEGTRISVVKHADAITADNWNRPTATAYQTPNAQLGDYPTIVTSDWEAALVKCSRLWKKNGILFPLTHSAAVHNLFEAYAEEQLQKYSRDVHVFCGPDLDTTVATACEEARNLNSVLATYCYNGMELYNENGDLEVFSSMHFAGACAGMQASSGVVEPLTGNFVKTEGLEYNLLEEEERQLIESGVTVLSIDEDGTDGNTGYLVLMALTTYTSEETRMWRLLYPKTVTFHINQLIRRACWPMFYGKRIHSDKGQTIQNTARSVLVTLSLPGRDQLLMADPSDPSNRPAFTTPIFTMAKGVGNILWSGWIPDEGNWLFINGTVGFQEPTWL